MFPKDTNVYHSFRTEKASLPIRSVGEGIGIVSTADDSSNQDNFGKMPDLDGVAAAKISPPPKARGNPGDENDKTDKDDDESGGETSEEDNAQESAGYGQGNFDDDDDSFGDMSEVDFNVRVTGGHYQVDDLSGSLKEMPKRRDEVYSDNIQLKNKKVNELQVRKTVRTKCFPCTKFIGKLANFLCPEDNPKGDKKKVAPIPIVILKELGMYNEDKFDEIDRAIVWNTYSKDVMNLLSQCRSSVICEIKKAMIPGTT